MEYELLNFRVSHERINISNMQIKKGRNALPLRIAAGLGVAKTNKKRAKNPQPQVPDTTGISIPSYARRSTIFLYCQSNFRFSLPSIACPLLYRNIYKFKCTYVSTSCNVTRYLLMHCKWKRYIALAFRGND